MDSKSCIRMQEPRSLQSLAADKIDSFGNTLLHQFVLKNSTSCNGRYIGGILRSLSGVPVNARNREGYTALHLAIEKQDYLMAERLLSVVSTIDVDVKSLHGGKTALHMAVGIGVDTKDVIDLVKRLIIKGAVVNAEDRDGNTALHVAVGKEIVAIAKILLENGASVNCRNNRGWTPLHVLAARKGI